MLLYYLFKKITIAHACCMKILNKLKFQISLFPSKWQKEISTAENLCLYMKEKVVYMIILIYVKLCDYFTFYLISLYTVERFLDKHICSG